MRRWNSSRKLGVVRVHFLAAPLTAALIVLAACDRPAAPSGAAAVAAPAPGGTEAWLNDGRPQSGLPRLKLYLGAKELNTELALTTAAIQKGLMWRTNVAETDGMLFVFGRAQALSFWMKNVPIDIDVAYLDPEGAILEVHKMTRQNTNPVPSSAERVQYALETAVGWFERNGIKPGVVVRTEQGSLPETFFANRPR